MEINKDFVPYEQALALKELEFNEPCFGYFYTDDETNYKEGSFDYRRDFVIDALQSKDGKYNSYFINKEERTDYVSAPTFSQAFRFFREKYKLHCWVGCKTLDNGETVYIGNGRTIPNTLIDGFVVDIIPYEPKPTYEEAELACLKKLIEIANENNNNKL